MDLLCLRATTTCRFTSKISTLRSLSGLLLAFSALGPRLMDSLVICSLRLLRPSMSLLALWTVSLSCLGLCERRDCYSMPTSL